MRRSSATLTGGPAKRRALSSLSRRRCRSRSRRHLRRIRLQQNFFESTFLRKATSNRSLVYHSFVTLISTLIGFVQGTVLGILLAVGIVHVRSLDRSLMPWLITSQTIPILAIAPDGHCRAGRDRHHRTFSQGADLHLSVVLSRRRRHGEGPALARNHACRPYAYLQCERRRKHSGSCGCRHLCRICSPR